MINSSIGEDCDDGNILPGDGCSPICGIEGCGNGIVDIGETCDDDNVISGDGCSAACLSEYCGNGHVDAQVGETCDDGNKISGDGCNAYCLAEMCGNGVIDTGEGCDDGNGSAGDGCNELCLSEACGNHIRDNGEGCDDGNRVSGDGCSTDCLAEYCGNGIVDIGENCDDGNSDDGDWCRTNCQIASCDDDIRNGDEDSKDCGGHCQGCLIPVSMVVTGNAHTCSLTAAGAATCWGLSLDGQLGYGNVNNVGDDEAPATAGAVDLGGHVVQLAAGDWHTCALTETGAVRCWGQNMFGQLGYGNITRIGDNEPPATAGDVNLGDRAVQLVAGGYHTCALLETGAVRCWGRGTSGQLGYGFTSNIGDNEIPASIGDVDVGGQVVQLAAGGLHTCGLLETGAVRCWGYGTHGQLGYGLTSNIGDNETPASIGDVDVGGRVVQLAAGGHHTCALMETGAVRCWGHGTHGQLGYGSANNMGDDETPATAGDVDVGGPAIQITAGGYHTCALMETGLVRCWGQSMSGQLGYGFGNSIGDSETPATAGDVDVGGTVIQIAAGGTHTCALMESNAVRCWGAGIYGQLGYGNMSSIGDDETPVSAGDVFYQ